MIPHKDLVVLTIMAASIVGAVMLAHLPYGRVRAWTARNLRRRMFPRWFEGIPEGTPQSPTPTQVDFARFAFPLVRRTFPSLIANDIVSVQPMSLPPGLAQALNPIPPLRRVSENQAMGVRLHEVSTDGVNWVVERQEILSSHGEPTPANPNALIPMRGASFLETGYVYAPYIPMVVTPTVNLDDFVPRSGIMSRYGRSINPDWFAEVPLNKPTNPLLADPYFRKHLASLQKRLAAKSAVSAKPKSKHRTMDLEIPNGRA